MKYRTSSRSFLVCASLAMVVGLSGSKALAEGDTGQGGSRSWLEEFAAEHHEGDVSGIFAYRSPVRQGTRAYVIWMKTPTELLY